MDDLIAFITARLDEDEATHRHAGEGRIAWLTYRLDDGNLSHTTVAADHHDGYWCAGGKLLPEPASVLIVYDQARMLREVAAKRAIVAAHEHEGMQPLHRPDPEVLPLIEARLNALEDAVLALAAVWSDHPDYRQEWALES